MKKNILIVILLLIIGCMGVELYNTKIVDNSKNTSEKLYANTNTIEEQTTNNTRSASSIENDNVVEKNETSNQNTISKQNEVTSKKSENVEDLILGDWFASEVKTIDGEDIGLITVFGTGIHLSNKITFEKGGDFSYGISITAGEGGEKYTVSGNTIKYSVASDMEGVFSWHTLKYVPEKDVLEEEGEDLVNGKYVITYRRLESN